MIKPFTSITVVVLVLFALVHLLRLFVGWPVYVNGVAMPLWISVIAFVVALGLATMVWKERGR
ncbi:MAG: hypothetical protein WBW61_10770 [Rhodanobacteraceae bacterium]